MDIINCSTEQNYDEAKQCQHGQLVNAISIMSIEKYCINKCRMTKIHKYNIFHYAVISKSNANNCDHTPDTNSTCSSKNIYLKVKMYEKKKSKNPTANTLI